MLSFRNISKSVGRTMKNLKKYAGGYIQHAIRRPSIGKKNSTRRIRNQSSKIMASIFPRIVNV